jgi:catechol 2,3-dioxygenase-like lactoylglutathione lyase family enzyme
MAGSSGGDQMILEHIGITVSDLERSIQFYTTVFGFRLLRKGGTIAYLYLDSELVELLQGCPSEGRAKPQTPEGRQEQKSNIVGSFHLGFRVDDMDKALEKIRERGGEVVSPPAEGRPTIEFVADPADDKLRRAAKPLGKDYWRIARVSDPDGTVLEIVER